MVIDNTVVIGQMRGEEGRGGYCLSHENDHLAFMEVVLQNEGQSPNSWECELSYVCVELREKKEAIPLLDPAISSFFRLQACDG